MKRIDEIKILENILKVKNSTIKIYENCESNFAKKNKYELENEITKLNSRITQLKKRPKINSYKVYTSSNGITAYGIKFRQKDKHISKSRINGEPKVSKETACEAVDYLLSH